jgi:hypothetical protein
MHAIPLLLHETPVTGSIRAGSSVLPVLQQCAQRVGVCGLYHT